VEVVIDSMARPRRCQRRDVPARVRLLPACAAAAAVIALAGCGSSKPAYCSDRTNLENSVKGLTNLNASSGISGLQAQLQKIQSSANALVNSAKGSFPNETSAIKSSLQALESSVKTVASNPSASQIATVANDASKFVNSVTTFTNATKSKCG
jgi:hypothetical protein